MVGATLYTVEYRDGLRQQKIETALILLVAGGFLSARSYPHLPV